MAAGEDLIGPKRSPRGQIVGLDQRAGDNWFPSAAAVPFGPVVEATDPLTTATRYFRIGVALIDNGDGTTSPVLQVTEISAEGAVI